MSIVNLLLAPVKGRSRRSLSLGALNRVNLCYRLHVQKRWESVTAPPSRSLMCLATFRCVSRYPSRPWCLY